MKVPCNNGDEYDCFTAWRRLLHWKAGQRARIKRRYRRRARRAGNREAKGEP